jgi:hypothetical protein
MSRHRLVIAALAAVCMLAAYVLAVYVAAAGAAPDAWEDSATRVGVAVHRDVAGPSDALASGTPDTLVLVSPPPLLAAERAELDAFVQGGGTLWLIGLHPENALPPADAATIRVLPGAIYSADGGPATLRLTQATEAVQRAGAHAILADAPGTQPLVVADASDVRDVNGNGKLDPGEPTGAFVVALDVPRGQGHVVVVAVEPPASKDALPYAQLLPRLPHDAREVNYDHPGAWSRPARVGLGLVASVPRSWWADALAAILVTAGVLLLRAPATDAPSRRSPARELVASWRERLRASRSPTSDDPYWRTLEDPST